MNHRLTQTDKTLLELLQRDFPLVSRPFEHISSICGIPENEVIRRVNGLISRGFVREISAIFNAGRLGYKSTLVALSASAGSEDSMAEIINAHPGVSHNYFRNHKYNIWFTITVKEKIGFKEELQKLFEKVPEADYLILPSVRTFKIGVNFRLREKDNSGESVSEISKAVNGDFDGGSRITRETSFTGFSEEERKIILKLQEQMKIVERPWKEIAADLNMDEGSLLARIKELKDRGAIKRISAVLRHRKVGYTANGMACFNIAEEKIEEAGNILSGYPEVSHCYQRRTYSGWKYALFAMVHCRSEEECREIASEMAKKTGCSDYIVLFSTKEYKKERVKYFME
jgi:DNA-binding Lrp family transcriptional regulator